MRLVCISDTHSLHDGIRFIPDRDVLVHAGDCTASGSLPQLDEFTRCLGALPHKHKVLIVGNHDHCLENYPQWSREKCGREVITNLQGEAVGIEGFNYFGFPWRPIFNAPGGERRGRFKLVLEDTQVLILHGPALHNFRLHLRGEAAC